MQPKESLIHQLALNLLEMRSRCYRPTSGVGADRCRNLVNPSSWLEDYLLLSVGPDPHPALRFSQYLSELLV
jgi:hypothetical protein